MFLGTKNVDEIVKVFTKTVNDLKDRAEDMKLRIQNEQVRIDEAKERQKSYAVEGVRAESIAKKLEGIIV